MKVGLLVQNNLWFCPYVKIYTSLLDTWHVEYDVIYWNRDNNPKLEGIAYQGKCSNGRIMKFLGYNSYASFIRKILKKNKYDRLIVFSPQIGIFISRYLSTHYKKRYIFDYRDLSIEQFNIFSKSFKRLLRNSYANVISSPGFKNYLPQSEYILSHNFNVEEVRKALTTKTTKYVTDPIQILTIGGIRDYESNSQIIEALSNKDTFFLKFVGRGYAKESLEQFAAELSTQNIEFEGYYEKEYEPEYIKNCSFLNIFYPDKKSHSSALSNRFYNSLIYRRPMIVTKGQVQGDYAEEYEVGIAISDTKELPSIIEEWEKNQAFEEYEKRCNELLTRFIEDYDVFKKSLWSFIYE